MADTTVTILDYIDNITVPGNVFEEPANEYWALVYLWDGMEWLYRQASKIDQMVKQQVNPDGKRRVMSSGSFPGLGQFPAKLLTSAFHWYAMSAYQYALTVGAIGCRQDSSGPKAKDYVQKVIPEVLAFRDKVAAHFVWALNDNRDNNAERLASIIPQLTFEDDSFHVGASVVTMRSSGKTSDSQAIKPWSISRVHEQLRERYWPVRERAEKKANEETNTDS